MTRMTKAEKVAQAAALRQQQEQQLAEEYFPRLMLLLEVASKMEAKITVSNGKFIVKLEDDNALFSFSHNIYTFAPQYDEDSQDKMYRLERNLNHIEEQRKEEARKAAVRQAALSKLSQEERELLGI